MYSSELRKITTCGNSVVVEDVAEQWNTFSSAFCFSPYLMDRWRGLAFVAALKQNRGALKCLLDLDISRMVHGGVAFCSHP